jgi:hypothetical protein
MPLTQIVRDFAERVRRYQHDPATAGALLDWLEENQNELLHADDQPSQWLSPQVWAHLREVRAGRLAAEQAHAAIVALIPEYLSRRDAADRLNM